MTTDKTTIRRDSAPTLLLEEAEEAREVLSRNAEMQDCLAGTLKRVLSQGLYAPLLIEAPIACSMVRCMAPLGSLP